MDNPSSGTPLAYGRLFRNRNFVALWLGQMVSFIGDYFNWIAVPIMVERLTGSALMVGLSVISNALPMLFLGPIAGVFVDRWDRKWTMIVSDLLRGLLVLLCLLVRTPGRPHTREEILDRIWGFGFDGTTRTVDNYILNLRQKLEDDPARPRHIVTVRQVGYKLEV